jgi:uncharacterized protein YidB (DUF937 family)
LPGLGDVLGSIFGGGLSGVVGGLGGMLSGLRGHGLESKVDSWVKPGPNQAVSPRELESAFEPGELDDIARRTGVDRGQLLDALSKVLPQMVDRMTPQGRLPQHEADLGAGGFDGLLRGVLGDENRDPWGQGPGGRSGGRP